jgi:hypothetical protein
MDWLFSFYISQVCIITKKTGRVKEKTSLSKLPIENVTIVM